MAGKTPTYLVHEYREAAMEFHHDEGELEVDDYAPVSQAKNNPDEGAYVQAWIWISDEEVQRLKDQQAGAARIRTQSERNRGI